MEGHKMAQSTKKPKSTTTAKPNSYEDMSFPDFGSSGEASAKIETVFKVPPPKGFVYPSQYNILSGIPQYKDPKTGQYTNQDYYDDMDQQNNYQNNQDNNQYYDNLDNQTNDNQDNQTNDNQTNNNSHNQDNQSNENRDNSQENNHQNNNQSDDQHIDNLENNQENNQENTQKNNQESNQNSQENSNLEILPMNQDSSQNNQDSSQNNQDNIQDYQSAPSKQIVGQRQTIVPSHPKIRPQLHRLPPYSSINRDYDIYDSYSHFALPKKQKILTGPMVIRVYPDGSPVKEVKDLPYDEDLRQYELSKRKLPFF